jgi:periplasmic copper chaperone A
MTSMNRRLFLSLALLPTTARAHSYKFGDIKIGHAWALPVSTVSDGQVFFPLVNLSKAADALVSARSDVCTYIELRENNRYDLPALTEFKLDPRKPLAMRPTANHLRLAGLNGPLVLGEKFSLVLDFLNAGEFELEVHVENAPGD